MAQFIKVNGGTVVKMGEGSFQVETELFMRASGSKVNIMAVESFRHQTARYLQAHLKMASF